MVGVLESNLIVLSPRKKSVDFSILIYKIMDVCEGYDPDSAFGKIKDEQIKDFINYIQVVYMTFQEFLKE